MRHQKPKSFSLVFKGVLFMLLSFTIFMSCNNKPEPVPVLPISSDPPVVTPTQSLLGTYLDTLWLSSTDYNVLRSTFPNTAANKAKLVFQFYFNKASASNPSLIAYASRKKNDFRDGSVTTAVYKVLSIGGPNAFLLPDNFVLGDQQIRIDQIDGVLTGAVSDTILFIPAIFPGEINVRYKICLKGAACPSPPPATQPSPPANAN